MRRWWRWRPSVGKKLTFLYVPDDSEVRQFRVPRLAFHAAASIVLVGLGLLGFFGVRYLGALSEGRETLRLHAENVTLRDRLGTVQAHVEELQKQLEAGRQAQERLRLLASLEPVHPDVLEAGAGGSALVPDDSGALPADLHRDLDITSARLSQMLRQARIQSQSFEEVLDALHSKKELWDRTPSVRPVKVGFVTSRFGRRMDPFTGQAAIHRGVDIAARPGDPVRATADGVVTAAGLEGDYGLMVEIDHGDGLVTRYAHCSRILVDPGQKVARNQRIASVGASGRATASHVHYEVLRHGLHQDPSKFILPTDVVVD
jgi:murein DD-endopeptidase MepM/ murein hydrolase activator NlpD